MLFAPPRRSYLFSDTVRTGYVVISQIPIPGASPPLPRQPFTTRSPSHTQRMTHTGGALTISSRPLAIQFGQIKRASSLSSFEYCTEPFLELIVVSTCSDQRIAAESAEVLGNLTTHNQLTMSNPKEALRTLVFLGGFCNRSRATVPSILDQ